MKNIMVIALLLVSTISSAVTPFDPAEYRDKIITTASDLVPWCKFLAESHYISQNITPYQWTISYHDYNNVFYVNGKLRVHGDDVPVRCTIVNGSLAEKTTIEIDDP